MKVRPPRQLWQRAAVYLAPPSGGWLCANSGLLGSVLNFVDGAACSLALLLVIALWASVGIRVVKYPVRLLSTHLEVLRGCDALFPSKEGSCAKEQQAEKLEVVVPAGAAAGCTASQFQVLTPEGQVLTVSVPAGATPRQAMYIDEPPPGKSYPARLPAPKRSRRKRSRKQDQADD